MRRTISPLKRWGHIVLLSGIGLIALSDGAGAQAVFDPYQPYNGDYISSSYPSLPNNAALPNAVREAGSYLSPNGGSRYNTYQSYLNSEEGAANRGGIGVPYYSASRSVDGMYSRGYSPNREADRRFEEYEAERNRRYQAAMKEKDLTKRATMLRALARMQMPTRATTTHRKPEAPRTMKPATAPAPSASGSTRAEEIAAEALARATTNAGAPAEGASAATGRVPDVRLPSVSPLDPRNLNNRRPGVSLPGTRSRLPSESRAPATRP